MTLFLFMVQSPGAPRMWSVTIYYHIKHVSISLWIIKVGHLNPKSPGKLEIQFLFTASSVIQCFTITIFSFKFACPHGTRTCDIYEGKDEVWNRIFAPIVVQHNVPFNVGTIKRVKIKVKKSMALLNSVIFVCFELFWAPPPPALDSLDRWLLICQFVLLQHLPRHLSGYQLPQRQLTLSSHFCRYRTISCNILSPV